MGADVHLEYHHRQAASRQLHPFYILCSGSYHSSLCDSVTEQGEGEGQVFKHWRREKAKSIAAFFIIQEQAVQQPAGSCSAHNLLMVRLLWMRPGQNPLASLGLMPAPDLQPLSADVDQTLQSS